MALDADDRLRLDYEQTTQYLRTLIDVRFRLLAFVPTVSGIAVAIVGQPRPSAELLGVGVLGLLATLGIFVLRAAKHADLRHAHPARRRARTPTPAAVAA